MKHQPKPERQTAPQVDADWTQVEPMAVAAQALRAMGLEEIGIGHLHAAMAAAQAIHIARTTLPLYRGTIVSTDAGVRVSEVCDALGDGDEGSYRPPRADGRAPASPGAVNIGFAPLTGMRRDRIEALLEHPDAPASGLAQGDGSLGRGELARMGSAITRAISLMGIGISAADVLPIAREILGPKWGATETMVAMAYAKGEHMLRHGVEMFDDAARCHPDGILFESVRKGAADGAAQEPPAAMTDVRRERIAHALMTIRAMGAGKVMMMATDRNGVFRGKRDGDVVKTHEFATHLRARLHRWIR